MSGYQYDSFADKSQPTSQWTRWEGYGKAGNRLDYTVDMVFCIDATGSMEDFSGGGKRLINMVKDGAVSLYDDLTKKMASKGKQVRDLRLRIIAFRDYLYDGEHAMMMTDFFELPRQTKEFVACVNCITAIGGGDPPEDGLEAMAYAIRSNWKNTGSSKRRQIIVLWTDAPPHPLRFGSGSPSYPKGMPRDLGELSGWWEEEMDPEGKRLVLFAPDEGDWRYISSHWENVVHYPSKAGNGLAERTYESILEIMAASVL